MQDHCTCLMMFNLNRIRPFSAAIVCPPQIACQHILRALEPFKAYDRRCGGFRLSVLDTAPSKDVDLFARHRRFGALGARLPGYTVPRIWHCSVKLARIEPVYYSPCTTAKSHSLFPLAGSRASRSLADKVINFVGA